MFDDVRLLVTPTTPGLPPKSGQESQVNGIEALNWLPFTCGFNLTRSPAGSIGARFSDLGLPVGLQLVGPQHDDSVGYAQWQRSKPFSQHWASRPPSEIRAAPLGSATR